MDLSHRTLELATPRALYLPLLLTLGLAASACGGEETACDVNATLYEEHRAAAEVSAAACTVGTEQYRTELVFGFDRAGDEPVSEKEWKTFVDDVVTPRFPLGLTVLDSYGQYKDRDGKLVCEPSKVIILIHSGNEQELGAIEEIRAEYKRRFNQETVLRIDTLSCIDIS